MFKAPSRNFIIFGILLILFSEIVFAAHNSLPRSVQCAFDTSRTFASCLPGRNEPILSVIPLYSAFIDIFNFLWPVVFALTVAFLLFRLFKKAANKSI